MIKSNKETYDSLRLNTKKALGMLKKVDAMIEADEYCGDIAQQLNATIGILKKMNTQLLKSHLLTCGGHKLMSKNQVEQEKFLEEFFRLVDVGTKK